ncbi:Multispanning membrane protein [Lasiodiplodia theobromae]|uniref:Multispanning membrane protein n=1 Tax=Lasiodiplodia theobromae TaxID=45133 RepID=UPI0015C40735|nr:Multispanning membrane protein [Lasiodiplodia theobromae]KAF4534217.1 Multispanning membrane protein [Lasiodiplodia theobromae]
MEEPSGSFGPLGSIVYALELRNDIMGRGAEYRKKIAECFKVDQDTLCKMVDKGQVQAAFVSSTGPDEFEMLCGQVLRFLCQSKALYLDDIYVLKPVEDWSDWKTIEGHETDKDSYKSYLALMEGASSALLFRAPGIKS